LWFDRDNRTLFRTPGTSTADGEIERHETAIVNGNGQREPGSVQQAIVCGFQVVAHPAISGSNAPAFVLDMMERRPTRNRRPTQTLLAFLNVLEFRAVVEALPLIEGWMNTSVD
jgi:hypothetical protein